MQCIQIENAPIALNICSSPLAIWIEISIEVGPWIVQIPRLLYLSLRICIFVFVFVYLSLCICLCVFRFGLGTGGIQWICHQSANSKQPHQILRFPLPIDIMQKQMHKLKLNILFFLKEKKVWNFKPFRVLILSE